MKKIIVLISVVLMLIGVSPVFAQPSDDEIEYAFSLSFQVFFLASIQSAFGITVPGVEVDETGMVLTDVDLVAMELVEEGSYATISGTILAKNESDMFADLVFKGGPVNKLEWNILEFDPEENFIVNITADGKELILDSSVFDQ